MARVVFFMAMLAVLLYMTQAVPLTAEDFEDNDFTKYDDEIKLDGKIDKNIKEKKEEILDEAKKNLDDVKGKVEDKLKEGLDKIRKSEEDLKKIWDKLSKEQKENMKEMKSKIDDILKHSKNTLGNTKAFLQSIFDSTGGLVKAILDNVFRVKSTLLHTVCKGLNLTDKITDKVKDGAKGVLDWTLSLPKGLLG